jgi:enediyne biosynthesis protein E4
VGTRSNRSAIGAKVRVQATIFGKTTWQMREVGGGNRHQNDLRPHFGLGDAPRAITVRVEWPSGIVEEFSNLAAHSQ